MAGLEFDQSLVAIVLFGWRKPVGVHQRRPTSVRPRQRSGRVEKTVRLLIVAGWTCRLDADWTVSFLMAETEQETPFPSRQRPRQFFASIFAR